MNRNNDNYNPFDPTGVFKDVRDAQMDTWAKMMIEVVNTDAYAEATGSMLDVWLSSSAPLRKMIENSMSQTLTQLKLPLREDVTRLAERLTNIELRLDDLEAKLDQSLNAPPSRSGKKETAASKRKKNTDSDAEGATK